MAEPVLIPSLPIPHVGPFPPHALQLCTYAILCVEDVVPDDIAVYIAGDNCCDEYVKPGEANTGCILNEACSRITGYD